MLAGFCRLVLLIKSILADPSLIRQLCKVVQAFSFDRVPEISRLVDEGSLRNQRSLMSTRSSAKSVCDSQGVPRRHLFIGGELESSEGQCCCFTLSLTVANLAC